MGVKETQTDKEIAKGYILIRLLRRLLDRLENQDLDLEFKWEGEGEYFVWGAPHRENPPIFLGEDWRPTNEV